MSNQTPDTNETAQTETTMPQPIPVSPAPPVEARRASMPMPATQQSAFKKGFGFGFGATLGFGIVATVLSILSLIGSILTLGMFAKTLSGQTNTDTTVYQTVWGKKNAKHTLRAIEIKGAILGAGSGSSSFLSEATYGYEVASQIDEIGKDDAAGLLLLMNTPGGTIHGSRAISDAAKRYQERTGHKVIAYVQGMSASGGMYSMAGADEIIADHGSLIGSIGVIMGPFQHYRNVTGITGNLLTSGVTTSGGITSEYLTAGKHKDFGNPYREMSSEERAHYQNGLDTEYNAFVNIVSTGRKIPAERIKGEFGALMFNSATAKEKGLVDHVMGRDEAFRHAATANGVDPANTKVVVPTTPGAFSRLFGAEARTYGHSAELKSGQTPEASPLCANDVTVLVYAGNLAEVCRK